MSSCLVYYGALRKPGAEIDLDSAKAALRTLTYKDIESTYLEMIQETFDYDPDDDFDPDRAVDPVIVDQLMGLFEQFVDRLSSDRTGWFGIFGTELYFVAAETWGDSPDGYDLFEAIAGVPVACEALGFYSEWPNGFPGQDEALRLASRAEDVVHGNEERATLEPLVKEVRMVLDPFGYKDLYEE